MLHATKSSRRLSRKKRLLFRALLIVLALAGIEAGASLVFWAVERRGFSYREMETQRQMLVTGESTGETGQQGLMAHVVHPYLGYVYPPEAADASWLRAHGHGINTFGFGDSGPTVHRRSDEKVLVGITGGSVAHWFSLQGDDVLKAELEAAPEFSGREVVIVRLALGGFKQPQQLMALNYILALGGELDVLINLDGVNEMYQPPLNFAKGVHPIFPRGWDDLVNAAPDREHQRLVGQIIHQRTRRSEWAKKMGGAVLGRSVIAQLVWKVRDRSLERGVAASVQALEAFKPESLPFAVRGPMVVGLAAEEVDHEAARVWRRCSLQMDGICKANRIRYVHCLQPNQYVPDSKPMSEAEAKVALSAPRFRQRFERGYPIFAEEGLKLRDDGVAYHDLRMIFESTKEPVYRDNCCHVNRAGNRLLAQRIASLVLLGGEGTRAPIRPSSVTQRLTVHPLRVTLESPLARRKLTVSFRDREGPEAQVSGAGQGVQCVSDRPDVVKVLSGEELVPLRHGSATVKVTYKGQDVDVGVDVLWRPVLEVSGGIAGTGGFMPRLSTDGQSPESGNAEFSLGISNVLGGARGVLVRLSAADSADPGAALANVPEGWKCDVAVEGTPGAAGGGTAKVKIPLAMDSELRGVPTFWRAYFQDAGSRRGWSCSNLLILTMP